MLLTLCLTLLGGEHCVDCGGRATCGDGIRFLFADHHCLGRSARQPLHALRHISRLRPRLPCPRPRARAAQGKVDVARHPLTDHHFCRHQSVST
eukprot:gene22743-biopygen7226